MRGVLPLLVLLACSNPKPPVACGKLSQVSVYVGGTETVEPCFEDPDGQTLTLSVFSQDSSIATAGLLGDNVQVEGRWPGATTVRITATDPDSLTADQDLAVLVPNRAPTGALNDVRLPLDIEMTISLADHFSDEDGQALTYTASSSAASVVGVAVPDTVLLVLTALGEGSAEIRVTASDGEQSVTVTFEATVLPTVLSDNFNSGATLDDWELSDRASAEIRDGYFVLERDTSSRGLATQKFGGVAKDWTVDIALRTTDEDTRAGVYVWTGHGRFVWYAFLIGEADYGEYGTANWIFLWYDAADSAVYWNPDWSMGTSDDIKDFTNTHISLSMTREDRFSVTVNGKLLFKRLAYNGDLYLAGPSLVRKAVGISLVTWPETSAGGAASMNWVAVTAEEFIEKGPQEHVRADAARLKPLRTRRR